MADTVMVVGGSGFIGSYLVRSLIRQGNRVVNYDIRPPGGLMDWMMTPYKKDVLYEQGGVENWPQLCAVIKKHKVNKVAHSAAPIDLAYLSRAPKVAFDIIATGTVNVLEACRLMDVQRLVFFSSIAVLPTVQYQPIDANHPTMMASEGPGSAAYGAGKIAGEAFCWAYRHAFNLDFVTIRPSAVYGFGSGNPIYINPMVEGALRGEPVRFESGKEFPRDYTHVEDVAGIAVAALNVPSENLKHRVFFAATGQPLIAAGHVAELVKELIPSADIEIKSGLSYADKLEIRYRGITDMRPVEEQLGYKLAYPALRDGMVEFIARYSEYLISQGKKPAEVRV